MNRNKMSGEGKELLGLFVAFCMFLVLIIAVSSCTNNGNLSPENQAQIWGGRIVSGIALGENQYPGKVLPMAQKAFPLILSFLEGNDGKVFKLSGIDFGYIFQQKEILALDPLYLIFIRQAIEEVAPNIKPLDTGDYGEYVERVKRVIEIVIERIGSGEAVIARRNPKLKDELYWEYPVYVALI